MASINVKSGGVYRTPSHVWVKSGGVWRDCATVYVKSGGTWRTVFSRSGTFPSNNYTSQFTLSGSTVAPRIALNSDGTTTFADGTGSSPAGANWATPTTAGIGSSYWINVTNVSGTGTMTGTFGSWLSLSAGQAWSMNAPTAGNALSRHCTYQISSSAGGSPVVSSGSMDFSSDRT